MNIDLKCGNDLVTCQLPGGWQVEVLRSKEPQPLVWEDIFPEALSNPINAPSFEEWLRKLRNLVIIVPDVTRYNGADRFLPFIYKRYLNNLDCRVLFALGNHRKQTVDEQRGLVSDYIFDHVQCTDHDCYDISNMTTVGQTRSGLEVVVNRHLIEADGILLTGSISFHYLAGFGGGRKAIFPGVAGYESIIGIHRKVFNPDCAGKHAMAKTGILTGNPMHEEIMEAISLIKTPMFLINTIMDDNKKLLNVYAGHVNDAHRAGCSWYMDHFAVNVDTKADVVLVSTGGFPKDINFIQAHKAIEHALSAVKKGGTMIVLGKCRDGMGHDDFLRWFDHGTSDEMEPFVRQSDKVYAQTAYATKRKAEQCRIILVSDLKPDEVKRMGLTPKKTLDEALATLRVPENATCYVIPDGSRTFITA